MRRNCVFRALGGRYCRTSESNSTRPTRSEEHTSELQSQSNLVCRLLLEKKKLHRHIAAITSAIHKAFRPLQSHACHTKWLTLCSIHPWIEHCWAKASVHAH